ncbi:DUF1836 domain-containing protein [Robertmurraya yapensis]|uniref:DUF1836 domain-containing protein n=2 Tax=Bacillaceae TaxID=186817 RepID=A0A3S0RMT8_9BACI|nr:DUF1836 domain-containing protein [Bacillus yapensis]RTR32287.1 DUF1836 domain-containing protein [Bacillus yapensis]TKS96481.1 DUF1836 domain-containing protein [Bacillus yapensis]
MEKLEKFIESLNLQNQISLIDVPEIDLYMDQVIQLFENKFKDSIRNDDEKILTKTMINNYAKSKLFFPIKNKKYSKEHLLLISLIYQLKGALSIHDIKETFKGINRMMADDESFKLDRFYSSYLELCNSNVANFKEDIKERVQEANSEVIDLETNESEYLEKVLLIASLVNVSNLYRRAAEQLVDEIIEIEAGKKEKN